MLQLERVGVREGDAEGVRAPTVIEALGVARGEGVGDPPVGVASEEVVGMDVALLPPASPPVEDTSGVFVGAWGVGVRVVLTESDGAKGLLLRVGASGLAEGKPVGDMDVESLPFLPPTPPPGVPVLKTPPPPPPLF